MNRLLSVALVASALSPASAWAQTSEIQKVHGSQAFSSSQFGQSVAASGSRILVGASHEGAVASTSGAAYIYGRQADGSWSELARMFPADGAAGDSFGDAVALSGDRALVGASRDDGLAGSDQGSAYVFERQSTGEWTQAAKLVPLEASPLDQFGDAVALDGNYAAVGSYKNDDVGTNSGKVWVFERQADGAWIEVAALLASDATEIDQFGWSLAMSGETLIVGADQQAVASGSSIGAAYVFERSGGSWSEVQKLVGTDSTSRDHFGWSVALDGDLAVIGAHNTELAADPSNFDRGSAYVFERSGGLWSQTVRLDAGDADPSDEFGYSVGVSGQLIAVGAWNEDAGGANAGAVYHYRREGGAWVETKLTVSDASSHDLFGCSVAVAGDDVVVGARNDDDFGSSSGSGYVFDTTPLSGTGASISVAAGGTQVWEIDAGHLRGGELYFVLGSVSGSTPGLPLAPGLTLPLNLDYYFNITLKKPNQLPLSNTFATLNAVGHATAAFTWGGGSTPAFVGLTLQHAYLTLDANLAPTFTSNAWTLELTP